MNRHSLFDASTCAAGPHTHPIPQRTHTRETGIRVRYTPAHIATSAREISGTWRRGPTALGARGRCARARARARERTRGTAAPYVLRFSSDFAHLFFTYHGHCTEDRGNAGCIIEPLALSHHGI